MIYWLPLRPSGGVGGADGPGGAGEADGADGADAAWLVALYAAVLLSAGTATTSVWVVVAKNVGTRGEGAEEEAKEVGSDSGDVGCSVSPLTEAIHTL